MVVKLLTIDLYFPGRSSLKEKRFVLSSLKTVLRRRFNVSVSEVDHHSKWQRSTLAIVTVGTDGTVVRSTCDKVMRMLEKDRRMTILDCYEELR